MSQLLHATVVDMPCLLHRNCGPVVVIPYLPGSRLPAMATIYVRPFFASCVLFVEPGWRCTTGGADAPSIIVKLRSAPLL